MEEAWRGRGGATDSEGGKEALERKRHIIMPPEPGGGEGEGEGEG